MSRGKALQSLWSVTESILEKRRVSSTDILGIIPKRKDHRKVPLCSSLSRKYTKIGKYFATLIRENYHPTAMRCRMLQATDSKFQTAPGYCNSTFHNRTANPLDKFALPHRKEKTPPFPDLCDHRGEEYCIRPRGYSRVFSLSAYPPAGVINFKGIS